MNLDIRSVLNAISENINHVTEWAWHLQTNFFHKIWTVSAGTAVTYTTGEAFVNSDGGSFGDKLINMFTNLTLLEFLSVVATVLLIVERGFYIYFLWKRKQRGDYEGKM